MLMVGVAKCPLYEVICYCAGSNGTEIGVRKSLVSVIWNSGVSAVEGFLMYWSLWRYGPDIQVSAIEGCLLSGVPLYMYIYYKLIITFCCWWYVYVHCCCVQKVFWANYITVYCIGKTFCQIHHLLLLVKILFMNLFSCVNDCIEDMLSFTAFVKILQNIQRELDWQNVSPICCLQTQ